MAGGKVMMRRQADVHDDHVRTVLPVCIQSGFGVPRFRYDLDVRLDIQRSGKAQADHEMVVRDKNANVFPASHQSLSGLHDDFQFDPRPGARFAHNLDLRTHRLCSLAHVQQPEMICTTSFHWEPSRFRHHLREAGRFRVHTAVPEQCFPLARALRRSSSQF
jgi:hypothetical protein